MIFEGLSAREAWERLSTVFERVAADCFCASANRRRGIYIYIYTHLYASRSYKITNAPGVQNAVQ